MSNLKPMLLTALKSYDKSQFVKDVTAGIIVAIIALPLSIALALASGVGPEGRYFTAIVAGFVISALGGSCVQIAGPTAGICNHRSRYRGKRWNGRSCDCNGSCRCIPDSYGNLPFRKPDQVYPVHHHNRFYLRYCCYHCDRAVKGLFGVTYPEGVRPSRPWKAGSISGKC